MEPRSPGSDSPPVLFTSDTDSSSIITLRSGGASIALSDDRTREELLARAREGKFVELDVDVIAFRQSPDGHNRNFVRLKRGTLRRTARSFEGMPVLVDHQHRNTRARIGTITHSQAEKLESGEVVYRQTLRVKEPHAVEGVLRGTLDRLSVAFDRTGDVLCSRHETPLFTECDCYPGDIVDGKPIEAVMTSAVGLETSFVNVPAVTGTGIDGMRAALAALRGGLPPRSKAMDPIRQSLGLAATASDEEVVAAIRQREEQRTALASREAQLAEREAQALAARRDGIIERLYAEGRLEIVRDPTGNRIASAAEHELRALEVDALDRLSRVLPKVIPTAAPTELQSQRPGPNHPPPRASGTAADNPFLADCLEQVGLSMRDVEAYGPQHRRAQLAADRPIPASLRGLYETRYFHPSTTGAVAEHDASTARR